MTTLDIYNKIKNQKKMIIILTGQPHSGKTTIAKHLKKAIEISFGYRQVFNIDGDDLREVLNNKDYSEQGRRKNIETAHAIAKYLQKQSIKNDVIISLVSPYRDLREKLKSEINCQEFYIHTTEIRGRENFHVGNYEKPLENFIGVDTTNVSEIETVNDILNNIKL
jgi:adenylylsulfate kinase